MRSFLCVILSICVAFSLTLSDAEAQDAGPLDPCVANLQGTLYDDGTGNTPYTQGTIFETLVPPYSTLAQTPHASAVSAIFAIPLNEQGFKSVYSAKSLTHAQEKQIQDASKLFKSTGLVVNQTIESRKGFQNFLARDQATFVIIAGHNQDGKFAFLGGALESLPILGEDCARAGKICIFVSCNSNDYLHDGAVGVGRELTLSEGVWITWKIQTWITSRKSPVSVDQLSAHVHSTEIQAYAKYHISYFALAGCTLAGTGAVVYVIVEGADT